MSFLSDMEKAPIQSTISTELIKQLFGDLFYKRVSDKPVKLYIRAKNKQDATRRLRKTLGMDKMYFFKKKIRKWRKL